MKIPVLIIGGNSGIGKACAEEALSRPEYGNIYSTSKEDLDVRRNDRIKEILNKYAQHHRIFNLIYSAGVDNLSWISDPVVASEALEMYEINTLGFLRVLHHLVHTFEGGSVVAISSDAGTRPLRTSIGYCASKAALDMAVRVAARELAPAWRVNAVAPGITANTPMTESVDEQIIHRRGWSVEYARKYEQSQIPMDRRAWPSEIARVVLDVLDGPEYLTGSVVTVNGGR